MSKVIDLGEDVSFEIKYRGETYNLREPNWDDVDKFQKDSKENDSSAFKKFIKSLGLPEDVISSMGITKVKKLAQGILEEIEVKKN